MGIVMGTDHGVYMNQVDSEGHLWCNDGPKSTDHHTLSKEPVHDPSYANPSPVDNHF
jgi:hypothetical protein